MKHELLVNSAVLLLEDDECLGAVVAGWLEARGAQVLHVTTAREALLAIEESTWDLIASDIELPDRNGLELASVFKEKQPTTPLLMMTAHERVDWAVDALRLKVDDFVVKPLEENDFLRRSEKLVEAGRAKSSGRSILAVGAHPDDVEIGCGGTLLGHVAAGDKVTILTLTAGAAGGPANERARESARAAELIGAELLLGDLADTQIPEGRPTISLIEDAIHTSGANVVYTHTASDNHQDHRSVHRATLVAARPVENLFCYQSPSSNVDFRPRRFIDIGSTLDRKVEVLDAYATQVTSRQYLTEEMIRSTAIYWGRYGGYRSVEPMEVIKAC